MQQLPELKFAIGAIPLLSLYDLTKAALCVVRSDSTVYTCLLVVLSAQCTWSRAQVGEFKVSNLGVGKYATFYACL